MSPTHHSNDFTRGVRAALPVMTGFVPIGMILGATCAQSGLSPFTAGLMSALNFAGGSEFAAVAMWSTVPPILMIAVTTWLINSRHIMLGASLTLYMGKLTTRQSLLVLALMCDEAWALSMQDITAQKRAGRSAADCFSYPFYLGTATALWATWWGSCAAGAMVGSGLGDLTVFGFEMAFPAIFIAILSGIHPKKTNTKAQNRPHYAPYIPWVASFLSAGLLSFVVSTPVSVALGSLAGLAAVWFLTPAHDSNDVCGEPLNVTKEN